MKIKIIYLLSVISLISGCANCPLENVDKISINSNKDIKISAVSHKTSILTINSKVKISFQTCHTDSICVGITLAKNDNIQFKEDIIKEFDNRNELINQYQIPYIYYNRYCYITKNSKTCDQNEITSKDNIIKTLNFNISDNLENYRDFIKTKSLINGGEKVKGEISEHFYSYNNNNEYLFSVKLNNEKLTNRFIQLPDLFINNKLYHLPLITITKTNENVCQYKAW